MKLMTIFGIILILILGLFFNLYMNAGLIIIGLLLGFLNGKPIKGFITASKSAFIGVIIIDIIFILYVSVVGMPMQSIAGGIGGFTVSGNDYYIPVIKQLIIYTLACGIAGGVGGIIRKVVK